MDAQECKRRLLALLEWYKAPESPCPFPFAPDFAHDNGAHIMSSDGWLSLLRVTAHLTDVTLADLVVDDACTAGAIVFEADDPITGLRHRISWLVRFHDGALKSLLTTSAMIPNLSERTRF